MIISILDRVENRLANIVGKGENDGYQNFLLFPQCFEKSSFLWLLKIKIGCKELAPVETVKTLTKSLSENITRKGVNADNQYFLFFPWYILAIQNESKILVKR